MNPYDVESVRSRSGPGVQPDGESLIDTAP